MIQLQRYLVRLGAVMSVLLVVAASSPSAQAQELNCRVSINYRQLSGSGFTFLDELRTLVAQYLNRNTWTDDRFLSEERIECNIQIIFQENITLTSFRARLILTSRRPIYGTTQNTNVLLINDENWQFDFSVGTPLVFETERFNAMTSVLDFYAYIMLGYDYDTFSELGGEAHFQKARRILELAQAQRGIGWDALGGNRSRAQLITQLLDPRFEPLRRAYFAYHFDGLDHFVPDTDGARRTVLDVLSIMQALDQDLSRQYTIDLFFSTKFQELTAIFQQSQLSAQAYGILTEVDPSHLTHYNNLVQ